MTSPVSVGAISVEVTASVKTLAKNLRKDVEDGLKGLNVGKLLRDSVGSQPVKIRVDPQLDAASITAAVGRARVPKVPVELDPQVQEAQLRARLAAVAARVKQTVRVDVEVDKGATGGGGLKAISGLLQGLGRSLPSVGRLASGLAEIGGAAQKAAGSSAQLGGSLAGAATAASGPVGLVIGLTITAAGAIASMGAAAIAAGPALSFIAAGLSAVAGAAAAIPGALVGAAAAFGTLSLGFKGISDAFKPKAGGGGGGGGQDPAARARQIAAAERGVESARRGITAATRGLAGAQRGLEAAQRSYQDSLQGVTDAQKRAAAAQQAVNRARVEAKEDLEDLGRALRGARLDEESAALAVTDALRELNEVKLSGNIPDIQRADIAYREALLTLENAKDTAQDYGKEQAEANKKGVEGSDKVVSALEDQADAQKGVKDAQQAVLDAHDGILSAQDALASANDGLKASYDSLASAQDALASSQAKMAAGSAGVGAAVTKLAPSAQRFVDAIKALKPAFEALRLDVQERLFRGLDKTVTKLGEAWIPELRITLGRYADTFNQFFRNLGEGLVQPRFIENLQVAAEGARQGMSAIGDAITTSLVPAFGELARASAPFLKALGEEIAAVVTEFSNWVLAGERSGSLRTFFEKASGAMHDMFTTGKLVTKIIGQLFSIITGQNDKSGKTALDSFNDGLRRISDWLAVPENQQTVRDFLKNIKDGLDAVGSALGAADGFITRLEGIKAALFDSDDEADAKSGGQRIGEALIAGIIAGVIGAVNSQTGILQSMFIGPDSITGKINEWLGIASPSTVMMETGRNLIAGIIAGMLERFKSLIAQARAVRDRVLQGVGNVTTLLVGKGRELVGGVLSGIGARFGEVRTRASQLKTQALNGLANAGSTLYGKGREFVGGLINGLVSYFRTLGVYAGFARVYIQNALANAGGYLYSHGRAVISGLINGIASRLAALGNFLNSIGSFIQNNKGPIEKDRVLLVGAGQAIMTGLIAGIGDKKSALAAELADVSSLIGGTHLPALATDLGSVSADLAVSKQAQIQVGWAPGSTGDPLLDAIKSKIKFQFNGDPMAAFAS